MRRAKTKSPATPAQLRIALENLLADVTGGELSGRNPWSLDSVKAADSRNYRKPAAANGSRGRYFADYLARLVK